MKIKKILLVLGWWAVFSTAVSHAAWTGLHYPHNSSNGIGCYSCHFVDRRNPPSWTQLPMTDIDNTFANHLCLSCHNGIAAPDAAPHSSLTTSDKYHADQEPYPDDLPETYGWAMECRDCHFPHEQLQLNGYGSESYVLSGTSVALDGDSLTMSGAGLEDDEFNGYVLIPNTAAPSRGYKIIDTIAASQSVWVKKPIDLNYAAVGDSFAVIYGKLIKDELETPASGAQAVKFFDVAGAQSFADGDVTYNGICEVCHTETSHFRNDGSGWDGETGSPGDQQNHENLGDKSGTDCIVCHGHTTGFGHGSAAGGCGDAVSCHGIQKSHPTHVTPSGDGGMVGIDCDGCHDTGNFPYFLSGTDGNADGKFTLDETDVCNNCHSPGGMVDGVNDADVGAKNNFGTGVYEAGDLKAGKELWCISCHDQDPANSKADASGVFAPSKSGDNSTYGYYVNGHGSSAAYNATLHGQNGPAYTCVVCHDPAEPHLNHALGDNRLRAVADDGLTASGTVSEVCLDCHEAGQSENGSLGFDATAEATLHSGSLLDDYNSAAKAPVAFPAYGDEADYGASPGYQCEACHDVHGTTKLAMVRTSLDGKIGGVSNPVAIAGFEASDTDLADLDPSDAANDGVCDACHGSGADPHPDTNHAGNHNHGTTGNACITCHPHSNSFVHGSGAGGSTICVQCHGHDAGSEYDPDLSMPVSLSGGTSSLGAGSSWSHSTHTENDADDLIGPQIYCSSCHDLTDMPKFLNQDASGGHTLAETDICDNCHSPGGTYDGVNDAVLGAKLNWSSGIYDSGRTLKSGKEQWCATCHDEAASDSKVDATGIDAPNVVGDEDGAYTYGSGWGYYKTGHGLSIDSTYISSGGLVYGAGKGCDDCHDLASAHIDHEPRTYSAASDNYQAGYRLKSINGLAPMTMPHPQNIDDNEPGHYGLCLSCHDANKYLLASPNPVTTSFRDDLDIGPWDGGDAPINIHEYHLIFNSIDFDSDWNGANDSEIACINCHNVHGSTRLSMVRDGKLVNREPGIEIYYDNVLVAPSTYSASAPDPANVTLNSSTGTTFKTASLSNVCSHCHGTTGYQKYFRSPPIASVAPSLDWTGEANYLTDGVDPNNGTGGDFFTFRIEYTDANSQSPRSIQLWVDEDDNGTYETNEKHEMYEVDSSDIDVSDGKVYRAILSIDSAGDSTLAYRFYASDGKFAATNGAGSGDPIDDVANTITFANNAPVLSWTLEDGYTADGVKPDSAASDSTFTFRVTYTDADNTPPSVLQLWLDRDDDSTFVGDEASELIDLEESDAGDTTYTDGKLYTKDVVVSAAGDGVLDYTFIAFDGSDPATGTPTTVRTLTVTSVNSAPQLAWTGETGYAGDGVAPDTDVAETTFTFRTKYIDADNDPPSSIQVWVDRNDDNDYDDAEEKLNLEAADGDTDYSDGKIYTKDVVLSGAGDGILNYRFYALDGTDVATGAPLFDSFLTIIVGAIKVSCQATGDYDYIFIQTAINNASDGDTILVADGNCTETITIDNKDLTIKSVNGAASTVIDGDGADTVVTIQNGADSILQGLTITGGDRPSGYGAGISIANSSPSLTNCIITGNNSQRAAGIYVSTSDSTLTISDSTISYNTSEYDYGGLYLANGSSAVISDSTFSHNSASSGAGLGMVTSSGGSLSIRGSIFDQNTITGNYGGATIVTGSGGTLDVNIDDTTFSANTAVQRGGAIYATDSGATFSLNIVNSSISGNSTGLEGGALYLNALDSIAINGSTINNNSSLDSGAIRVISAGSLTVTDTIIRDNTATQNIGGGMRLSGSTTSIFTGCSITGNSTGQRGGAGYIDTTSSSTFKNCIVSGNKATSFEGGGFLFNGASAAANIINSTFAGNKAGTIGGAIASLNSAPVTIKNSILYWNGGSSGDSETSGSVTASYSDINQTGYEGNNNLTLNPLFVDPLSYSLAPTSSGDYHLLLDSVLIDAGTNVDAPTDDFDGDIRPVGSGVDMGADEVMTVANNAPVLNWTSESDYIDNGVSPEVGADGGTFEFRVEYSDADNDPPSIVQVWIDINDDGDFLDGGEKIEMTAVDGDVDYTNGKLYSKSETLAYAGDGVIQYRFYSDDSVVVATGIAVSPNTFQINTAPSLAWLGSGDYVSDGSHPDAINGGDTVLFKVNYLDANNNPPSSIQVWVDMNDDADYSDSGEQMTMTQVDSNDTVYSDGKEYSLSKSIDYAGDGTINYRFFASDGLFAAGAPISDTPLVITNSVPVLTWLGTGNYVADGVSPNGALSGASYEFRVTYTDDDNQAPTSIQLYIDKNDNGDYLDADEKVDMTPFDGDSVYSDGKIYTKTLNLTHPGGGDDYLDYQFAASDGIDSATGVPVSTSSPVGVFLVNNPPDLDWTGESGYTTDGVDPDAGSEGDDFAFRVKYTDIENSAPISTQVWIDLDDDTVEDAGELTSLTQVEPGDTAYDDGKLYSSTVNIAAVTNPTTSYLFKAHDGTDPATGNATAVKTITVATAITVCSAGAPTCDYATITNAIAAATDGAFIVVKDGTYSENISYAGKNITISSENGAGSTTIRGSGANSAVVTFNTGEGAGAVLDGFTIDNQGANTYTRGIYVYQATPTIKNSIITGNVANNANESGTQCYGGGGVCIIDAAPAFDNCTISANAAANRHGCGMYIKGGAGGATITNSTIGGPATEDGNQCTNGTGGGIYFTSSSTGTLSISDSNIQFNYGYQNGGGLFLNAITNPTVIANTTIVDNYTQIANVGYGGGIHANNAPLDITGGAISRNTSGVNRGGGGIYITTTNGAATTITGTTINSNNTGSQGGGGIYMTGSTVLPTLDLSKVKVQGNRTNASGGGGIYIVSGEATIVNSLITGNRVVNTYNYGGGIRNNGTLNLYFSTIADNYAHGGGGLYANGTEHIYNSIIWGNSDGLGDPEIKNPTDTLYLTEVAGDTSFVSRSTATSSVSTTDGDYHLQANSNAIDSADATNKPAGDDDIDGNTRPTDIAGKGDGVDDYDKGAYEYIE